MLLKYQYKQRNKFLNWSFYLTVFLLISNSVFSQDASSSLQVHGFAAQGIIDVDGTNYVSDEQGTSLNLTEIGLNASYQYSDNLRFSGQAVYINGGNRYAEDVVIDYLLMDWSFYSAPKWQANLYLGRIKNYHWLYSSARDVPMTRPSIFLPQSVYFDATRNMSVGGDGAALTVKYFDDTLGDLDLNLSTSKYPISEKQMKILMGKLSNGDLNHEEDVQASIYWQPQMSLWRFGVAITDADFKYQNKRESVFYNGDFSLTRLYLNGEFQVEKIGFSFELLQETMKTVGLLSSSSYRKTVGQGGFIQMEYQVKDKIRALGRLEHYYADKKDKSGRKREESSYGVIPRYFGYQHQAVLGLTYNLSINMQLQVEHHWVKGTARLSPLLLPDPIINKQEYWQIAAMQFVYRF